MDIYFYLNIYPPIPIMIREDRILCNVYPWGKDNEITRLSTTTHYLTTSLGKVAETP